MIERTIEQADAIITLAANIDQDPQSAKAFIVAATQAPYKINPVNDKYDEAVLNQTLSQHANTQKILTRVELIRQANLRLGNLEVQKALELFDNKVGRQARHFQQIYKNLVEARDKEQSRSPCWLKSKHIRTTAKLIAGPASMATAIAAAAKVSQAHAVQTAPAPNINEPSNIILVNPEVGEGQIDQTPSQLYADYCPIDSTDISQGAVFDQLKNDPLFKNTFSGIYEGKNQLENADETIIATYETKDGEALVGIVGGNLTPQENGATHIDGQAFLFTEQNGDVVPAFLNIPAGDSLGLNVKNENFELIYWSGDKKTWYGLVIEANGQVNFTQLNQTEIQLPSTFVLDQEQEQELALEYGLIEPQKNHVAEPNPTPSGFQLVGMETTTDLNTLGFSQENTYTYTRINDEQAIIIVNQETRLQVPASIEIFNQPTKTVEKVYPGVQFIPNQEPGKVELFLTGYVMETGTQDQALTHPELANIIMPAYYVDLLVPYNGQIYKFRLIIDANNNVAFSTDGRDGREATQQDMSKSLSSPKLVQIELFNISQFTPEWTRNAFIQAQGRCDDFCEQQIAYMNTFLQTNSYIYNLITSGQKQNAPFITAGPFGAIIGVHPNPVPLG